MSAIVVESGGLFTTLQAQGRCGSAHLGVGPAGALDVVAARLAGWLVGNRDDAALLELTLRGPRLRLASDGLLALTGADFQATVDGLPVPLWRPLRVRAGSLLDCGSARRGSRGYLAMAGAVAAAQRLGSGATGRGFGGLPEHEGRALQSGDVLHLLDAQPRPIFPSLTARLAATSQPFVAATWSVAWSEPPLGEAPLRLVPGPDFSRLSPTEQTLLYGLELRASAECDRMGLRLTHSALATFARAAAASLPSAGVATGAVQLLPSGELVVLLADRQTTGGYPLLGCVASVDHGRLAQCKPGDVLRFCEIPLAAAQTAYLRREQALARLRLAIREKEGQ